VLDNVLVEVQHPAELEIITMLRGLSDNRTHDVEVYGLTLKSLISFSISPCQVMDIVDAFQEVVYQHQQLLRQVAKVSHDREEVLANAQVLVVG
jgi:hypothetical protein